MKKLLALTFFTLLAIGIIACDNTTANNSTEEATTTNVINTTDMTTESTSVMTTELPTVTEIPTTTVRYTGIEITNISDIFYSIGESFDKSVIELTASKSDGTTEIISSDDFGLRGFDSTDGGKRTIFVTFDKYVAQTDIYILEDYAFEIDMDYYVDAINLRGDRLKIALNEIISDGFTGKLYGDARDILPESDVDPNNPNNVILVYTGYSVDSTWDSGVTWNREHVWPQSRLGVYVSYTDDEPSRATDLFNLKPADPNENAFRSNDYFGVVVNSELYEPRDQVKGDVARILFYMATRYFVLTLNDDEYSDSGEMTMGLLSTLLEWNEQDPVDDFEMHRNDVIYSYQGNRNPFIDYPEFANLIWGDN